MTHTDDRPTIAERYQGATHSSNLKVEERRKGDVDHLIAAGWVSDGLGPLLYRLAAEYDTVRAQIRGRGPLNQTEHLLILAHLKTLMAAKEALGRFAIAHATKTYTVQDDRWVLKLAGRALDVFLDPLCHSCDGRGFNGGGHRGERQIICRACSGSGKRRHGLGKDAAERQFAGSLLGQMDSLLFSVEAEMRRFLRARAADAKIRAVATPALVRPGR